MAKTFNYFYKKKYTIEVWQSSKYASEFSSNEIPLQWFFTRTVKKKLNLSIAVTKNLYVAMVPTPRNDPCHNSIICRSTILSSQIIITFLLEWIWWYISWWKRSLFSKKGQHRSKVFSFELYNMFYNSDSIKQLWTNAFV